MSFQRSQTIQRPPGGGPVFPAFVKHKHVTNKHATQRGFYLGLVQTAATQNVARNAEAVSRADLF